MSMRKRESWCEPGSHADVVAQLQQGLTVAKGFTEEEKEAVRRAAAKLVVGAGWQAQEAGEISQPEGECRKSAGEDAKPRWDLLPMAEVEQIVKVLSFGASKYGAHNWKRGARWGRYYAALMRHLVAWWGGQELDPDTGLSHLAHAGCCLLFLMAYQANGWGSDDRGIGDDGQPFRKGDGL